MGRQIGRWIAVVIALTIGLSLPPPARAQNAPATNSQEGDNEGSTSQEGSSESGDAIAGMVAGIVANGRTSVDARNTSSGSDVESGEVIGNNISTATVGLQAEPDEGTVSNVQDGDNTFTLEQAAEATSGDGVDGQIIGVITEAGGSADIVAANTSEDNDVETGVSTIDRISDAFVGLEATTEDEGATATNDQTGDNEFSVSETGSSPTGDGVSGQVIGVVSAGATSLDAENTSTDNDLNTIDHGSTKSSEGFVGLRAEASGSGTASNTQTGDNEAEIIKTKRSTAFVGLNANADGLGVATNDQTGDNSFTLLQDAPYDALDAVAGQVVGAVTGAGGDADLVVSNTSEDNDIDNNGIAGQIVGAVTGGTTSIDAANTSSDNDLVGGDNSGPYSSNAFVGLNADSDADTTSANATNEQDGDNAADILQENDVEPGDALAGQVIGVVTTAGGSAGIVAENLSEDNSVEVGFAIGGNATEAFVGLDAVATDDGGPGTADNEQRGDNDFTETQSATAVTGDGVAGQVVGVVSSGATSVDAKNASTDVDVEAAAATARNSTEVFVGLAAEATGETGSNLQEGDNAQDSVMTAGASSGDAIAGQVAGFVTGAGGTDSAVVENLSEDVSATSGESTFDNVDSEFVGLAFNTDTLTI